MPLVDVVIVAFNNRAHLRDCVAPLAALPDVRVIVVDNASSDSSLDVVADLPVTAIRLHQNRGFAAGCNDGWKEGDAAYVLFLNPDATLHEQSLRILVAGLAENDRLGAIAPRIEQLDGSLAWSQRRFPRLRSTYARAFFLHRLFPQATWVDELIRDPRMYAVAGSPDWISGACLLLRRAALEDVGGWDDGFFLYGEDIDLCRRLRARGYELRFEPAARTIHLGGASAPRSETLPILAASRMRYNRKHRTPFAQAVDRLGIALGALTHLVVSRGGTPMRVGHARALAIAVHPRAGRR